MRTPRSTAGAVVQAFRVSWRADRAGTVIAAVLQIVGALSVLAVVLASKLALDAILGSSGYGSALVLALVLLALATAASGAVGTIQQQHQRLLGERVGQQMWLDMLVACVSVDLERWNSTDFMDRLDRVRGNALSRPTQVVISVFAMVGGGFGIAALTAALLSLEPLLVPILLLAGLPAVAVARVASRTEFGFAQGSNPVVRQRLYLKQLMTGRAFAAEVRAFDSGRALVRRHGLLDAEYEAALRSQVRRRQALGLASVAVSAGALSITLVLIVVLVDRGRMTLADAGAAAIAARLLGGQLSATFTSIGGLIECRPFLADVSSFLRDAGPPREPGRARELADELVAEDVSFRYAHDGPLALDGVTVRVGRGQVVAVVGENGCGKTTLAKVVAGLYQPGAGAVTWDRQQLPPADLTASVSVLFQDFVRYQMSATDNIAIAQPHLEVDRLRVSEAARRADIEDALMRLPHGPDTVIGLELSEGSDLSGGQWQRLALARAFYRDSSLLVLDEPTAAMDPLAESKLFADVRKVLQGRAALLISHRFSSVKLADYIYVMSHGKVVEEGTHEALVAIPRGHYAEMYALQAAAYLA